MQHLTVVQQIKFRLAENTHRWLRPVVVIGVLLLSAAVAYFGTADELIMLVGLVVAALGAVVLLKVPELGLLALIGSMLVSYDGPSHFNVTMLLVVALFGLWLVDVVFNQKPFGFTDSPTYLPLIVLTIISLLAFAVGQLPLIPFGTPAPMGAQLGGMSMFILSAMVFFLVSRQIRDVRWLRWMVWLFVGIGAVYTVSRFVPPVERFTDRFFSGYALGAMFWTWLVALSLGQAMFNGKLSPVVRAALGGLAVVVIYHNIVIGRDWKSGWLPLLAVVGTFLVLWSWRWLIPMGLAGVVAAGPAMQDLIASDSYSYSTRLDAWRIVWEIVKVNPIFGLGPSNYRWYTPLFRIRGYAVQFNSHNQYVDVIAQIGLIGLAAYLWFFGAVAALGWKLRHTVPDGFERAYVFSVLAGLAGTLLAGMLGDWVIPFFYNITLGGFRASMLPWLFMGGLVVLQQLSAARE